MPKLLQEVLKNSRIREELLKRPRTFKFPKGAQILVGVSSWLPHVGVVRTPLSIIGPVANLLDALANSINFTYTLIEPPDGAWGSKLPNGSWTGMMGQVTRKEVDIALGPFGLTEARARAVDFSQSIGYDPKCLIVAKSLPEMNPWGFLFPLAPMVWGALLLALVGVWIVMMLLDFRPKKRYGFAWASAQLFNHISVLLQQGLTIALESTWQRMLACSWLIVVALCSWSYSGNLMSQLAVRYVPQKIKTVQNMVDDKRLTVIQLNNTALTDYLKAVQSGVFRDVALMWNQGRMRYLPNQEFPNALDTLVRRGDHVMMTTCMTADLYMSDLYTKQATCDFYKAKEEFLPLALGLIGQKESPLMPAIDSRISYVLAAGLYDYWLLSNIGNSSACNYSPSKITVQEPLALSNIWGLYAITGTGLLLSLVVFLLELISARVAE